MHSSYLVYVSNNSLYGSLVSAYSSGFPYFGSQSQYDGHVGDAVEVGPAVRVVFAVVCVTEAGIVVRAVGYSVFVTVTVDIQVVVINSVSVAVGEGTTTAFVVPS